MKTSIGADARQTTLMCRSCLFRSICMVNETLRKVLLYTGIAFLLLGVVMIAFAGGGMIMMDVPLIIVGGALTGWALIEGRRAVAS